MLHCPSMKLMNAVFLLSVERGVAFNNPKVAQIECRIFSPFHCNFLVCKYVVL